MNTLVLKWLKTNNKNLKLNHDTYLYAFTRGTDLLYIGQTTQQTVQREISKRLKKLEIDKHGLVIWLGYPTAETRHLNQFEIIDKQLIVDAECLLIYCNQPQKNVPCKKNYTKRSNLRIINLDCNFLYHSSFCDSDGKRRSSNS